MDFPPGMEHVVRQNEPLAPYSWLRMGGEAKYFAEPTNLEQLTEIVRACNRQSIPIRMLGGGSNLLIREGGVDGMVVFLSAPAFSEFVREGNRVRCGGGTKLAHLISFCVGEGLGGLEHLVGIPGSVGGALHGNASTRNGDIGQRVVEAKLLTRAGEIEVYDRKRLQFSHHTSSLDELVILEVLFDLEPADIQYLTQRMQTLWIVRRSQQPKIQTPSIIPFVEPDVNSVAELVELAGLKGAVEGNVHLSSEYPNYLIANQGATSSQVLALIQRVRETVASRTGVQLQLHLNIW